MYLSSNTFLRQTYRQIRLLIFPVGISNSLIFELDILNSVTQTLEFQAAINTFFLLKDFFISLSKNGTTLSKVFLGLGKRYHSSGYTII